MGNIFCNYRASFQSEDVRGTIYGPDDEEFRPEEASKALRKALSGGIRK